MDPVRENTDGIAIVFDNHLTRAFVESADEILSMGVLAQMNLGADESDPGYDDYIMLLDNEHVIELMQALSGHMIILAFGCQTGLTISLQSGHIPV